MPIRIKIEESLSNSLAQFEIKNKRCALIYYTLDIIQRNNFFDLDSSRLFDYLIIAGYILTDFVEVFKQDSNIVIHKYDLWKLWAIFELIGEYSVFSCNKLKIIYNKRPGDAASDLFIIIYRCQLSLT